MHADCSGRWLACIFASSAVAGTELPCRLEQVGIQLLSVPVMLGCGGVMSFVILRCVRKTMGLRVSNEIELMRLFTAKGCTRSLRQADWMESACENNALSAGVLLLFGGQLRQHHGKTHDHAAEKFPRREHFAQHGPARKH